MNPCADEVEEYLARFTLWQLAHEAVKGAFLTVIAGSAFSLVSTLVFPKTLQEVSLQVIKDALFHDFNKVNFEESEHSAAMCLTCTNKRPSAMSVLSSTIISEIVQSLASITLHCRRRCF